MEIGFVRLKQRRFGEEGSGRSRILLLRPDLYGERGIDLGPSRAAGDAVGSRLATTEVRRSSVGVSIHRQAGQLKPTAGTGAAKARDET